MQNATETTLQSLNPVHNAGIRICIGAFRTSPVESILVDAAEPPLSTRRGILCSNYILKVSQFRNHPTYKCIFEPDFRENYERRTNLTPPFGIRYGAAIAELDLPVALLDTPKHRESPPWEIASPRVDFSLVDYKKDSNIPTVLLSKFYNVLERYDGYVEIYTDGSKSDSGVGCAAVTSIDMKKSIRLHKDASVFSAELYALLAALTCVLTNSLHKKFVIFSDSLSSLKAIESIIPPNTLAYRVRYHCHLLKQKGKDIRFVWVPSHVGIPGNEKADKLAKRAAVFNQYNNNRTLPLCDFKASIRKLHLKVWSDSWLATRMNKLRFAKSSVEP